MKNLTEQTVDDLSCAKAQGRMFMIGNGESLADVEFYISAKLPLLYLLY